MIIYQIQTFYWDDGAKVLSEWFISYKRLADIRAKELEIVVK